MTVLLKMWKSGVTALAISREVDLLRIVTIIPLPSTPDRHALLLILHACERAKKGDL